MRRLAYALWPFLVLGCAHSRAEGRYTVQPPPHGWTGVGAGGADRAWWHDQAQASLYTDSNCGQSYEDVPLSRLTQQILSGFEDPEQLAQQTWNLLGREALTTHTRTRLDGVPVTVATTVVKRDNCIYDFVLIAPESAFGSLKDDYEGLVAGFSPRGR